MDITRHLNDEKMLTQEFGKEKKEQFFEKMHDLFQKYNLDIRPELAFDACRYVIEEEYIRRFNHPAKWSL